MESAAKHNTMIRSLVGLTMWLIYGWLSGAGHWMTAGFAGLAIAAAIVAEEYRRDAVKIMDSTSVGYFVLELVIVMLAGSAPMRRFHLPVVWGVFALVAWITIWQRFPFTLQYSREQAPPEIWASPTFYRMNLHLTGAWALIFTLGAVLGAITLVFGHVMMLGIVIPSAAMAFGFVFSNRYPDRFLAQFEAESRVQGVAHALEVTETIRNAARP